MRYTTLIDIREMEPVYRNPTVRLVYLHMVLSCGYHDNDRGLVTLSIRGLAAQVGCSVGAVRNALKVLNHNDLCKKYRGKLYVRTFIREAPITKVETRRPKKRTEEDEREAERHRREREYAENREKAVSRQEFERMLEEGSFKSNE